jgi:predicted enzyme related to lactoylglutathione lyase
MTKHEIVWIEIPSSDRKQSAEFYAKLFGWTIDNSLEDMDYTMYSPPAGPGGGFPELRDGFEPGDILISVSTDDIDASLALAESLGGKTIVPKSEIPGIGWYAIFEDPTGNNIGLVSND